MQFSWLTSISASKRHESQKLTAEADVKFSSASRVESKKSANFVWLKRHNSLSENHLHAVTTLIFLYELIGDCKVK
jgi:hypothetical protein